MLERLDAARIEPPRLLHGFDRLVVAAHRAQELAEGAKRFDRAGIEGDRMREIGLGAVPIPVVLHLHAAKGGPSLGQPLVEGERPLGRRRAIGIASSTCSGRNIAVDAMSR